MEHSDSAARAWFSTATSHSDRWLPDQLLASKRLRKVRISVVIPAHNEETTIFNVVSTLRRDLMERIPLIDELVVMDSDSTDRTARIASAAGARVYTSGEVLSNAGVLQGKGEALWKSLFVTKGDLLVFIDADLTVWGPHFVTGLLGPLLEDPAVALVKGFYDRLSEIPGQVVGTDGGRVTELVARPLLNLWWPDLAYVVQPLAGEWAIRRSVMETFHVPAAYGVEMATLLDTYAQLGLGGIAQVDLGVRAHKHQSNHNLALMAAEILAVFHSRRRKGMDDVPKGRLMQFGRDGNGALVPEVRSVPLAQRPPAAQIHSTAVLQAAR